jgi:hypothetical protein
LTSSIEKKKPFRYSLICTVEATHTTILLYSNMKKLNNRFVAFSKTLVAVFNVLFYPRFILNEQKALSPISICSSQAIHAVYFWAALSRCGLS